MKKIKTVIKLAAIACVATIAKGQTVPNVSQTATKSSCVNIVALSGAKVDCSNLTTAQKKALENIPAILKMAVENRNYFDAIMEKLSEMSFAQGPITQSNSGGVNVQQATTGDNSPIINSPITIGQISKTISPQDAETLSTFFGSARAKAKVLIAADEYSGQEPFPVDFLKALQKGGWDAGGIRQQDQGIAKSQTFHGATIIVKGSPIPPGEVSQFDDSQPVFFILKALGAAGVKTQVESDPDFPDAVIKVFFTGGFGN